MPDKAASLRIELSLLGALALLWGSSYVFIKIAVQEIPPVTLIATRVAIAALFLLAVMAVRRDTLPREAKTWRMLGVQSIFSAIASWTLLAWGQQYIDAGLASVLNSTAPIFVFVFTALVIRHEPTGLRKLAGALIGILGVCIIVGPGALAGLGREILGQAACLLGAALYGCAAIYGKRFGHISPTATAAGTMICATAVLVPAAAVIDAPWTLRPGPSAIAAALALSFLCTGFAMLLYFRLVRTLGSLGVASQAYLRASVSVVLGIVFLGEQISPMVAVGLGAALLGVAMINWPSRRTAA